MKVITALLFPLLWCSVTSATALLSNTKALKYLFQYGYATPSSGNFSHVMDETSYRRAIGEFQAFAGLKVTGTLDINTQKMMMVPRCGVKDKMGTGEGRAKRYALQGSSYKKKYLTYKITKYPSKLKRSEVDIVIRSAFDVWTRYTDLTFTPKSKDVDINILFHGRQGDIDTFDGPGGTLAHAYFPNFGSAIHFDESEKWTVNFMKNNGNHLLQVAAHEIGHSLGLNHAEEERALMAPFYKNSPFSDLYSDDIKGIQAIYGKKTKKTKPRTGKKMSDQPSASNQIFCDDPKLDTIFDSAAGVTYVFKGDVYWGTAGSGYPKRISDTWTGLPGNIDASFTYLGKTYFFKGSQFWRYTGTKVDGIYPKEISRLFVGVPNDLDAATVQNGRIFFFKGSNYWRFEPFEISEPRPISDWIGVPNNLSAAYQTNDGYIYFFKGDAYYRFDDEAFAVDEETPAFPWSTAYWWFRCKNAPSGTIETN